MLVSSHRSVLRKSGLERCINMLPEYQLSVLLYVCMGGGIDSFLGSFTLSFPQKLIMIEKCRNRMAC